MEATLTMNTEHQIQVSLINAYEVFFRDTGKEDLARKTLARLTEFTGAHFRSEELIMQYHEYPHLEEHRAHHARLLRDIEKLGQDMPSGSAPVPADELRRWLAEHVDGMDEAFALWLRQRPEPRSEPPKADVDRPE